MGQVSLVSRAIHAFAGLRHRETNDAPMPLSPPAEPRAGRESASRPGLGPHPIFAVRNCGLKASTST
ncbi:MAG: hypothetical protein KC432_03860, partial [Thermomicrobiales bacterium]|nr:hypothetical protein [Thermomicrobiales bacterium]